MSKIMMWHVWKVTYLRRNVTIVFGASYHLLGSWIYWYSKIRFWLQGDWQFSKLQHLASYISRHNAMAYDTWYLMEYSSLCPRCSVYTLYRLTHTMELTHLVHRTHTLSTVLTANNTLLTQMCDHSNNWLRQSSYFLVSSPLDIFNSPLPSSLVLVNLEVHTSLVRSLKCLQTSSSAWSACLRSLRASSIFCLISILFAPDNWSTAFTSLCLLFCQFLLHLFLATFLCCWFCVFLGMSQCHMPVPACWSGSRIGFFLFLISYSLGRFCMLTWDLYQLPMHSASFWGPPNFNQGQSTEMSSRLAHK